MAYTCPCGRRCDGSALKCLMCGRPRIVYGPVSDAPALAPLPPSPPPVSTAIVVQARPVTCPHGSTDPRCPACLTVVRQHRATLHTVRLDRPVDASGTIGTMRTLWASQASEATRARVRELNAPYVRQAVTPATGVRQLELD
jgi:hypothetical protein